MAMKTNKWKSHAELPGKRDPGKVVLLEINPRKRRKSDLTLGFLDSSDYVRTLARQFSRIENIHRMRQSAVSNQRATPVSRYGSMIPTKSQLRAFSEVADDPTKAHAIARPSLSPSPANSPALGPRLSRTMTSGTFKKKYSGLAGQTNVGRNFLKSNAQKTILKARLTKSQFCPAPVLNYDEGSQQDSQASGNDQLSLGDSSEDSNNQLPDLDVIDRGEQEMKSQKSNRTVEEVSDTDDQ
jgi:hypothetical protein